MLWRLAGSRAVGKGKLRMNWVRLSRKSGRKSVMLSALIAGAALVWLGTADGAGAAERRTSSGPGTSSGPSSVFVSEMNDVQRVKVTVNKSRTFRVDTAFSTIVA